jgi:hypothetical protein
VRTIRIVEEVLGRVATHIGYPLGYTGDCRSLRP